MSTLIATPESALPQWEGRAVPWATRWTGEVVHDPVQVSITREGLALNYKDGRENLDGFGVLWKREGLSRGGVPQYSELNTYRQRASMTKRKCQVCGSKIDERPIRWLMAKESLHRTEDGDALTISPPTCSACIPLALDLCPYLKKSGYAILKVLDYERWGVYGEAVVFDRENERARDLKGVYVPYKDAPIPLSAVVAFQQVVRLTKYVIEESSE